MAPFTNNDRNCPMKKKIALYGVNLILAAQIIHIFFKQGFVIRARMVHCFQNPSDFDD